MLLLFAAPPLSPTTVINLRQVSASWGTGGGGEVETWCGGAWEGVVVVDHGHGRVLFRDGNPP